MSRSTKRTTHSRRHKPQATSNNNQNLWLGIGLVAILLVAIVGGIILFGGGDDEDTKDSASDNGSGADVTAIATEDMEISTSTEEAPSAVVNSLPDEITVEEAYAWRENGAFILDVRETYEWDDYHVPDATLIPLGELASRVNEVPSDQVVLVMCNSGNRSQSGRDILKNAGFTQVTSIDGGIQDWMQKYPDETCYNNEC